MHATWPPPFFLSFHIPPLTLQHHRQLNFLHCFSLLSAGETNARRLWCTFGSYQEALDLSSNKRTNCARRTSSVPCQSCQKRQGVYVHSLLFGEPSPPMYSALI
eukprot:Trichotokara_eunicae@DN858_c0_g1_i1.p1